jgi:hypothetical protein
MCVGLATLATKNACCLSGSIVPYSAAIVSQQLTLTSAGHGLQSTHSRTKYPLQPRSLGRQGNFCDFGTGEHSSYSRHGNGGRSYSMSMGRHGVTAYSWEAVCVSYDRVLAEFAGSYPIMKLPPSRVPF